MNGIVHTEGWKMWELPNLVSTVKIRVLTRRKKRILAKAASQPLNLELSQHRNKTVCFKLVVPLNRRTSGWFKTVLTGFTKTDIDLLCLGGKNDEVWFKVES